MPFTLAHPAAVLPLARRPLVTAALVAGALAPDVPYFLPLPRSAGSWYEPFVNATTTHAWPGALTVAVPTAAALLGLWWFVRPPLLALVARGADGRDEVGSNGRRAAPGNRRRLAVRILVSLVLGVLTHVVWDAFTHGDGALVQHVAWLHEPLVGDVPAARVLQHASTTAGLLVLTLWAGRRAVAWWRAGGRPAVARREALAVGAVVVAVVAGAVVGGLGATGSGAEVILSAAAKSGGTAAALTTAAAAAAWWSRRAAPRSRGGRTAPRTL